MIKGIILIGVGQNLNRTIRLCYSFGINKIYLYKCKDKYIKGALFSAKNKVDLVEIDDLSKFKNVCAIETVGNTDNIQHLHEAEYIAVGGENITLSKKMFPTQWRIDTPNNLCLTVESALSIALYEAIKYEKKI